MKKYFLFLMAIATVSLAVGKQKFSYFIETEEIKGKALNFQKGALFFLYVDKVQDFYELYKKNGYKAKILKSKKGIVVRAQKYRPFKEENFKSRSLASFYVDFDEKVFSDLDKLIRSKIKKITPESLSQFVYDYIDDKNYSRLNDLASQVAKSKKGDCSEHAVLLTALLRYYKFPARVIYGIYVQKHPKNHKLLSIGHAWTEFYNGHNWIPLDSTRPSSKIDSAYLPIRVLNNEAAGNGFEGLTRPDLVNIISLKIAGI